MGVLVSGSTQDAMSENMKASAFSCGERSVLVQPSGKASLPVSPVPDETWRSLSTMRPHAAPPSPTLSMGVGNAKYSTAPELPLLSVAVIQDSALGLMTESTERSPPTMGNCPATVDPATFTIQSLIACPLGNEVLMRPVAVKLLGKSNGLAVNVTTVG